MGHVGASRHSLNNALCITLPAGGQDTFFAPAYAYLPLVRIPARYLHNPACRWSGYLQGTCITLPAGGQDTCEVPE